MQLNTIQARLTGRHLKGFQLSQPVKGKKILDIGCSFGWFEKLALEAGAKEIIGIEPNEKDLRQAKKDVPRATFINGSLPHLPFPDNHFEMAVLFDVLEHLPNRSENEAVKEISRVVKRGGKLIVSVPNRHWFSTLFDPAWYFGHRHYQTDQIKKFFKNNGFKVVKIDYGGGYWETFSLLLFYLGKKIFRRDLIFKKFFTRKTTDDYLKNEKSFLTLYIVGEKR